MYLIGSIDLLSENDRNRLVKMAEEYSENEFERFVAEVGWEDWMEDFTDAADGEPITDCREIENINDVLKQVWNKAHFKTATR
jgi:hypothetical protein